MSEPYNADHLEATRLNNGKIEVRQRVTRPGKGRLLFVIDPAANALEIKHGSNLYPVPFDWLNYLLQFDSGKIVDLE